MRTLEMGTTAAREGTNPWGTAITLDDHPNTPNDTVISERERTAAARDRQHSTDARNLTDKDGQESGNRACAATTKGRVQGRRQGTGAR